MPLGMIFLVASHLTNIHTTIYGSQVKWIFIVDSSKYSFLQVADFFGMPTPVLTKYLGLDD